MNESALLEKALDLHRREQFSAAEKTYLKILRMNPKSGDACHLLGLLLHHRGKDQRAKHLLQKAIDLQPENVLYLYNRGEISLQQGEYSEAINFLQRCIELEPSHLDAHLGLAEAHSALNDVQSALAQYQSVIAVDKNHVEARLGSGNCQLNLGRIDAAIEQYRLLLNQQPGHVEANFNLGICYDSIGKFEDAVTQYSRTIQYRPDFTRAYYNLATIGDYQAADSLITALKEQVDASKTTTEERVTGHFALGRFLECRAEYAAAFVHYHAGNRMHFKQHPFDIAAYERQIEDLITAFYPGVFSAMPSINRDEARPNPLLIVGMPRSGTTLLENRLARHESIIAGGELPLFPAVLTRLRKQMTGSESYPADIGAVNFSIVNDLAGHIQDELERYTGKPSWVIDKLPSNYLRLGLVALLAPGARIIDCRRDPMDSCVSCYTEHFAHGQSFSYDLEALAAVWSGYDRLMRHWKQVLPLRILEVNYERLVENPVRELKKVMDFMSLDWQKSINDPAMYRQPIRTASSWQARQAIHSKSVGRWTRFENHLLGLQQALVKHARHHAG